MSENNEQFDLVYKAARKANNQLFTGIANFLYKNEKDNREILDELTEIKALLRMLVRDGD